MRRSDCRQCGESEEKWVQVYSTKFKNLDDFLGKKMIKTDSTTDNTKTPQVIIKTKRKLTAEVAHTYNPNILRN